MAMGISNTNENISNNYEISQKDKKRSERDEKQDILMKVITKIFSAKVVLEKLPDICARNNVTVKEESLGPCDPKYDQISEQKVKGTLLDMFTKSCPKCNDKSKGRTSSNNCRNCNSRFNFKCKKCNKELKTYVGIVRHLSSKCNFEGHYYQCPDCPFQTVHNYIVKAHVKKSHSEERKNSIKMITREDYRRNLRTFKYKCEKCDREFQKESRFIDHFSLYCNKLEYAIDRTNEANSTEIEGSPSTEVPDRMLVKDICVRYCLACDKENVTEDEKNLGTEKCSACNKTMSIKCLKCSRNYKSINSMIHHLKTKCALRKNYKCSKCEYISPLQLSVLKHYMNVHEPISAECSQCGRILKNNRTLTMHMKYCNKKPYLFCTIGKCSFKTNNRVCLTIHINRHLQKDNTECSKCGKIFKNQVVMKSHRVTCGMAPRFRCDICSHISMQKRDLEKHILHRHLRIKIKDYDACPKCGVTFELKYKKCNKGHVNFCKTSKPHLQCKYCYYLTNNTFFLNQHVKNQHAKEMENDSSKTEE